MSSSETSSYFDEAAFADPDVPPSQALANDIDQGYDNGYGTGAGAGGWDSYSFLADELTQGGTSFDWAKEFYVDGYFDEDNSAQDNQAQDNSAQESSVQDNAIQGNPVQYDPVQVNQAQVNAAQVNTVQDNWAHDNLAQVNPVQDNSAQFNPVQVNPVQYHPVQVNPAQVNPIQNNTTTKPYAYANYAGNNANNVGNNQVVGNADTVQPFTPGFGHPVDDNPVTINRIPRSELHPAVGSSANGNYVPANVILGNGKSLIDPSAITTNQSLTLH